MDPDATWERIRALTALITDRAARCDRIERAGGQPDYARLDMANNVTREQLVGAYADLTTWLAGGGFPPRAWPVARKAPESMEQVMAESLDEGEAAAERVVKRSTEKEARGEQHG